MIFAPISIMLISVKWDFIDFFAINHSATLLQPQAFIEHLTWTLFYYQLWLFSIAQALAYYEAEANSDTRTFSGLIAIRT